MCASASRASDVGSRNRRASQHWQKYVLGLVAGVWVAGIVWFIQQDQAQRTAGNPVADRVRAAAAPIRGSAAGGLELPRLATVTKGRHPAPAPVLKPASAPARQCSQRVTLMAVGDCPHDQHIGVFVQECDKSPKAALAAFRRLIQADPTIPPGYANIREFRTAGGILLDGSNLFDGSAYLPAEVWALKGEELFVFPACEVGLSYHIPLPSAGPDKWVNVTVQSTSPRVLVVDNFLSDDECKELIGVAHDKMAPSTVSGQGDSARSFQEQSRTSSTAWLPTNSHTLAAKLYDRVSELVGIPFRLHKHIVVEDLQALRYEVNQHYHTHHDYFDPKLHHGFLQGDGRNRFITVLFYLNDVEEGGETCFPMAGDPRPLLSYSDCGRGLRVPPQAGKAVIFYSLEAKGQRKPGLLDESSWHSGCDVKKGTKWGANYWVTLKHVHE